MLICPDCRQVAVNLEKHETYCNDCGWRGKKDNSVLHMMRSKRDDTHRGYQDFYERLAIEDLESPVMEQEYAAALNEDTALELGNVHGKYGCDLGVGRGHLLRQMLGRGANMTGVDIALAYLNALDGYGDLRRIQADAEHLPFRDEFDFITCTDVLEHVINPGNLLYCINDALKPGGMAAIRVPANENLLVYSTHLGCIYEMVHLRSFTEVAFRRMLEGAGFKIQKFETGGHSLAMMLPSSCDEEPELKEQVQQVRAMLAQRGVTPSDLMKTPCWFKNLLSKPYSFLAIAEKTHRIQPSKSNGFDLEPVI